MNTSTTAFHTENTNRIELMMHQNANKYDSPHIIIPSFDNPKLDIEIDYSAIKSDKHVSASKY